MSSTPPPPPSTPAPPVARRGDHRYTRHGYTVEDPYAWLKDAGYPEVKNAEILDYLKAENAYFDAVMAPLKPVTDDLFREMKARLKTDEESVPSRDGDWLYWWKFAPGAEYRQWWRKPAAKSAKPQLMLDEMALARGHDYFRLGALAVSPDGRLMAYMSDTNGSERFTLRVRDLATDRDLPDVVADVIGDVIWSNDSRSLFYTPVNENWRPFAVRRHLIGAPPASDESVYEEADSGFFVSIGRTQSRNWLTITAADHTTSEVRLLSLDAPAQALRQVSPRVKDREYSVDEREGLLYILTNDTHPNFRVATATLEAPGVWRELIAGSDAHYLQGLTAFRTVLVVEERQDGLDQIRIRSYDDSSRGGEHFVEFPEASYSVSLGDNREYDIGQLRLGYQSMVTPQTVYDYDLAARVLIVRKVQEVPSGYDKSRYVTERLWAPARDGERIPVSIVYRADFVRDGSRPLHLYGYGAYGYAVPPGFSTVRLSYLDRGFAYAIAHIRGGDDLGRRWFLTGRAKDRWNTFHDFVDAAKFLIDAGYARAGNVSASGGSAGGELMGVVVNTDPELWRAIVAEVPFVDVLNTMQDESLPLTPMEWPEWGNPITDKAAFELIRSYSPYDNVAPRNYPPMLITGGLNDPRVTYWEPAKWAAKLRATKTDRNLLLLKTNLGAGHGGKSGRFDSLTEDAEQLAFILRAFGLAQ